MMSALLPDIAETSRWYEDKVRRYGYDHRGLGFRNRSSQEKRFQALLRLGDFAGRRLLDVGCGFADLLQFLHDRGIQPIYSGIDVCEPMISRCRERYPASARRFTVADVLEFTPVEQPDFVVASGIFGLDSPGTRERIQPTLERMFEWSRVGVAVNFLSRCSPAPAEARVYLDPPEALAMALEITPAACLDHAYLPNDFTIFLYKTPPWAPDNARAA